MSRWLSVPLLLVLTMGCGKKGPPLPPLVRLPAAPGEFSIARRSADVVIELKVPTTNTDGSTPADLDRVDVYAYTSSGAATAAPPTVDAVVRNGTKIGAVVVNPPVDPDASQEEVDQAKAAAPPDGVDQGARATVIDRNGGSAASAGAERREYFAVGVNTRGRRGALTARIAVPSAALPPVPAVTDLTFDETALTLTWRAEPDVSYRVYDSEAADKPLNTDFLHEPSYVERAVKWDAERCLVVRSVVIVDSVVVESDPSAPRCVTPKDTFPPKAPGGLQGIAGEGSVNLIWDPSSEPDLAGYLVMRAVAPQTTPEPISQTVITETTFRDTVASGSRVTYAVQAVDKSGNRSPMSAFVEETVR